MVKQNKATTSKASTDNFKWVTAEPAPVEAFITLDNQERIYFNSTTKKLFGNSREFFLGYDAATKTLIIADAAHGRLHGVKPFRLDSRSYAKAHVMVDRFRIDKASLPLRYEYRGTEFIDGVESLLLRLM